MRFTAIPLNSDCGLGESLGLQMQKRHRCALIVLFFFVSLTAFSCQFFKFWEQYFPPRISLFIFKHSRKQSLHRNFILVFALSFSRFYNHHFKCLCSSLLDRNSQNMPNRFHLVELLAYFQFKFYFQICNKYPEAYNLSSDYYSVMTQSQK